MGPTSTGVGVVASWWGYATADSTLVGILVVTVAALAVLYVVLRGLKHRAAGGNTNAKKTPGR